MQVQNNLSVSTLTSKTNSNSNKDSTKFQEALEHFDELYQQSQVSGVSTYLFTKALEDLGLHKGDELKGIELLKQHHFHTEAPSIDAILKYGNINQKSGNHSYMKEQTIKKKEDQITKEQPIKQKLTTTKELPKIDETPIAKDIKRINKKLKIDVSNAKNYFDVAQKLATTISPADRHLNINQILSLDKYTIPINSIQNPTPLTLLLQMSDETKE